jgi:cell division protein ZapA
MGQVSITLNGRTYPVACDDGQEEHVVRLAAYLDKRSADLLSSVGTVSEGRLLVMLALLVADELAESYDETHRLQDEVESARHAVQESVTNAEERFLPVLERLAERIDALAARLESA